MNNFSDTQDFNVYLPYSAGNAWNIILRQWRWYILQRQRMIFRRLYVFGILKKYSMLDLRMNIWSTILWILKCLPSIGSLKFRDGRTGGFQRSPEILSPSPNLGKSTSFSQQSMFDLVQTNALQAAVRLQNWQHPARSVPARCPTSCEPGEYSNPGVISEHWPEVRHNVYQWFINVSAGTQRQFVH